MAGQTRSGGQAEVTTGDNVLVWGAAGAQGVVAVQICKMLGANPIAVVGGKDKIAMVKALGASAFSDHNAIGSRPLRSGHWAHRAAVDAGHSRAAASG